MSVETKNDDFCINCKVNLRQGQKHSEACKFLQQAEKEKSIIEEKSNKAIQKVKDELEVKAKNEKEELTKEVRAQLEKEITDEKKKKKQLLEKKDYDIKLKFFNKIIKFIPTDDIDLEEFLKMSLDEIKKYYRKIIILTVEDNKKIHKITCPKCLKPLGKTVTHDDAVKVLNNHKKVCPKNSNLGKWLVLGLVFTMFAGSIAFVVSNKHILKKGKKDDAG